MTFIRHTRTQFVEDLILKSEKATSQAPSSPQSFMFPAFITEMQPGPCMHTPPIYADHGSCLFPRLALSRREGGIAVWYHDARFDFVVTT